MENNELHWKYLKELNRKYHTAMAQYLKKYACITETIILFCNSYTIYIEPYTLLLSIFVYLKKLVSGFS